MISSIEELLNELEIDGEGAWSKNGSYVIDIESSDEFGKVQSILESNEDLEELTDSSTVTADVINISYLYDDYEITLSADFDSDDYQLVITEFEYDDSDDDSDEDDDEDYIFDDKDDSEYEDDEEDYYDEERI